MKNFCRDFFFFFFFGRQGYVIWIVLRLRGDIVGIFGGSHAVGVGFDLFEFCEVNEWKM